MLTRRKGEEISIAGDIRISVLSVLGNKVRIRITAPPSVRVDREEVRAGHLPIADVLLGEPALVH